MQAATRMGGVIRRHIIRIDRGEEIVEVLTGYCAEHGVVLAMVSAIGAVGSATIGYFETATKSYHSKTVQGDLEITSLVGTVTTMDGQTYLHLHITLADETLSCVGGHLNRATVSGTCEVVLLELQGTTDRAFSDEIGLNLLAFN